MLWLSQRDRGSYNREANRLCRNFEKPQKVLHSHDQFDQKPVSLSRMSVPCLYDAIIDHGVVFDMLKVRIGRYEVKSYALRTAEQLRCPSGLSGLIAARVMRKSNALAEAWTVKQLQIAPNDHVLEIGFGPGCGLREALSHVGQGTVEGIDTSAQMVKMVSRSNQTAIADKKLRLWQGDASKLPFEAKSFDKVFAVNVYYFWNDPDRPLSEIHRILRDGGQMALYLIEKTDLMKMKQARTDVFKVPETDEVVQRLEKNGFKGCTISKQDEGVRTGVCIRGRC
jgi:SAM-dependent methyltransferase